MSEMVERMAKAIYVGLGYQKPYRLISPHFRAKFEKVAREVLKVMKDPTQEMSAPTGLLWRSIIDGLLE